MKKISHREEMILHQIDLSAREEGERLKSEYQADIIRNMRRMGFVDKKIAECLGTRKHCIEAMSRIKRRTK